MSQLSLELDVSAGARFSPCRNYRYSLWRIWDNLKPKALCIGLNPSNAGSERNDPTIIHLSKMLKKLGYGGFYMANLFAWISSKPESLLTCNDPAGKNDVEIRMLSYKCRDVIVCWGSFKEAGERIEKVLPLFPNALCFGVNKDGTPCHPLAMMYQGKTHFPKLFKYHDLQQR